MAKGLPFFKFYPSDWLFGGIVWEDMEAQGLFINICALYWEKSGDVTIAEIQKRWNKPVALDSLLGRFILVKGDKICIGFLDEQFEERKHQSKVNSKNGSAGGRPPIKGKKAVGFDSLSENKPNGKAIEQKRTEKNNIEDRKLAFAETLKPFVEKYGDKMIFGPTGFYSYWTEPNKSKTKFRMESEKTWDISRRLATWAENDKSFSKLTNSNSRSLPPGMA